MTDRVITLKKNADLAAIRNKAATDPAFLKALATDPAGTLAHNGVVVDAATAKSIKDHLSVIPPGANPAALAVSVVVSAVL